MPFLIMTVIDRRHCWVVVDSGWLSKQWWGGNKDGVTSSDAGAADPRVRSSTWQAESVDIELFRGS